MDFLDKDKLLESLNQKAEEARAEISKELFGNLLLESVPEDGEELTEGADVFLDEDTGEEFYMEIDEETLQERKIIIRVNSKGQRIKKIKCGKGRVAKSVNGRTVCVTPTGHEKLVKKLSIKQTVRTKKAKGAGFKKRVNFRRQKALRKRKQMGLGKQDV